MNTQQQSVQAPSVKLVTANVRSRQGAQSLEKARQQLAASTNATSGVGSTNHASNATSVQKQNLNLIHPSATIIGGTTNSVGNNGNDGSTPLALTVQSAKNQNVTKRMWEAILQQYSKQSSKNTNNGQPTTSKGVHHEPVMRAIQRRESTTGSTTVPKEVSFFVDKAHGRQANQNQKGDNGKNHPGSIQIKTDLKSNSPSFTTTGFFPTSTKSSKSQKSNKSSKAKTNSQQHNLQGPSISSSQHITQHQQQQHQQQAAAQHQTATANQHNQAQQFSAAIQKSTLKKVSPPNNQVTGAATSQFSAQNPTVSSNGQAKNSLDKNQKKTTNNIQKSINTNVTVASVSRNQAGDNTLSQGAHYGVQQIGKTIQTPAHQPDKSRIKFNIMTGQKEQANRTAAGKEVSPNAVQGSLDRGRILIKSNYQLQQQNSQKQQSQTTQNPAITQNQSTQQSTNQTMIQTAVHQLNQQQANISSSVTTPKYLKFKSRTNKPTNSTGMSNESHSHNPNLAVSNQDYINQNLTNDQIGRSRSRDSSQTSHNMSKTQQSLNQAPAPASTYPAGCSTTTTTTHTTTNNNPLKKQLRQSSDTKASRTSIQPNQTNNSSSVVMQQSQIVGGQSSISGTNSRATVGSAKVVKPKSAKRSSTMGTSTATTTGQGKVFLQSTNATNNPTNNSNNVTNNTSAVDNGNGVKVTAGSSKGTKSFRSKDARDQNQSGSVEVKKARFTTHRDAKGSPNNVSSGGDQSQKANKSFQFGHHAPLMSCSSGGDSSTAAAATKHGTTTAFGRLRSTSGKNGPQIKITKAPEDVSINQAPISASTRAKPSSQNQNSLLNENTYNLFSILQQQPATTVHEEQKKFLFHPSATKAVGEGRKHNSKKRNQEQEASSTGGANNINSNNSHTNFLISQSKQKPTLSTSSINQNSHNGKDCEKVYTSLAAMNKQAVKQQQQHLQQQQMQQYEEAQKQKQNSLSAVEESISQQSSASNPPRINFHQVLTGSSASPSKQSQGAGLEMQQQSRDDSEYRKMVDQVREKQTELAQLLQKLQARERARDIERREQERELSCERIKNQLKLLERKLSQFTQVNQKHQDVVDKLERQGQGGQGASAQTNPKRRQENSNQGSDERVRSVLNSLSEIQKSAKEYLNLNPEPLMSHISEGINSLMTVDENQTQFTHSQIGRDSEILDTFRHQTFTQSKSKASLEGPGGTPDQADASIVSYSYLLTEELQQIISGESSQRNHYHQRSRFFQQTPSADSDLITLADIELDGVKESTLDSKKDKNVFGGRAAEIQKVEGGGDNDPDTSIMSLEKDLMMENRRQASTVIEAPQLQRFAHSNMIPLNNYIQEEYEEGNSEGYCGTNEGGPFNTSLKSNDSHQNKQFKQYQQYQVDHQVVGPPIGGSIGGGHKSDGYGIHAGLSSSASSGLKSNSTAGGKSGNKYHQHLISSSTNNTQTGNANKPQIITVNKTGTAMTHPQQNQDQVNISHLINDLKDIKKLELIRQESGGSQQIKRVDPPRLKFVGKKNVSIKPQALIGTVSGGTSGSGGAQVPGQNFQLPQNKKANSTFEKKTSAHLAGSFQPSNDYEYVAASHNGIFSSTTPGALADENVSAGLVLAAQSDSNSQNASTVSKSLVISLPQNAIRASGTNMTNQPQSTKGTNQPKMHLMIKTPTNAFQTGNGGLQFGAMAPNNIQTVTNAACTFSATGINDTSLTSGSSQKFSGKSIKISKSRFQSVLGPQSKSPECRNSNGQQEQQVMAQFKKQINEIQKQEENSSNISQLTSQTAAKSIMNNNTSTNITANSNVSKNMVQQTQQHIGMTGGSGDTTTVDLLFSKIRAHKLHQSSQQNAAQTPQNQQVINAAKKVQQRSLERVQHRSTSNENAPGGQNISQSQQQHMQGGQVSEGTVQQQKMPATTTLRINIKPQQSQGMPTQSSAQHGKDVVSPVPVQKLKTMKNRTGKI